MTVGGSARRVGCDRVARDRCQGRAQAVGRQGARAPRHGPRGARAIAKNASSAGLRVWYAPVVPAILLPLALLGACRTTGIDPVAPPGLSAAVGYVAETASPDTADTAQDTADTGDLVVLEPSPPPLLIVILADDLRADALEAMPNVNGRLVAEGVSFSRAYSTVPLCCPVRSSFLQGGWYPCQTGVYTNTGANGGIHAFDDGYTLATRLQAAGFRTALVGKYLNGYELDVAPYVPPGWDLFLATTTLGDFTDTQLIRGTSTPDAPGEGLVEGTGGAHLTGWLFDEALRFVDAHRDEPVFLLLTPQTPHLYGTPAQGDLGTWAGYAPRPPSFAEPDMSDKPAWMRGLPVTEETIAGWDADAQEMMENLASLDRGVGAFLDGLAARGLDERAVLVLTSDNGYLNGEHRFQAKGVPYEESVRVPLVVRGPGVFPRAEAALVAMNLDVPATIADLAGLPEEGEGKSFAAAMFEADARQRDHVFIEGSDGAHPVWAGVVTERWKYVEWGSGEVEIYDLGVDPFEMESRHGAPPEELDVASLAAWVDEHRSLAMSTRYAPGAAVGVPYTHALEAWGGTEPYTWRLDAGMLPDGLVLSPDGVVSGVPTRTGAYTVTVRVTDSGASPLTGEPATWAQTMTFAVGEASVATAAWVDGEVRFRLPGRPGERAAVSLYLDDTRDTPPLHAGSARVRDDGFADVRVPSLPAGRSWAWTWEIEGRDQLGGTLAP